MRGGDSDPHLHLQLQDPAHVLPKPAQMQPLALYQHDCKKAGLRAGGLHEQAERSHTVIKEFVDLAAAVATKIPPIASAEAHAAWTAACRQLQAA